MIIAEIQEDVMKEYPTIDTMERAVHHPGTEIQDGVILKVTETLGVPLTEPSVTLEELKEVTRETKI